MNDEAQHFLRLEHLKVVILALMGGAFVALGTEPKIGSTQIY